MEQIKTKLLPHQIPHVNNLHRAIQRHNRALDASDTGTGKTYSAVALCQLLDLKPFIICPKSVIPSWLQVLEYFGVEHRGIANYELIKNCRYYPDKHLHRTRCPYMKVYEIQYKKNPKKDAIKKKKYKWDLPLGTMIIFDESHKCKNVRTNNSDLLFSLSHHPIPILMLSATACDRGKNFQLYGYVLGLYDSLSKAQSWIERLADHESAQMELVHDLVFPDMGSRMKVRELQGTVFQDNDVRAELIEMKCVKEIEEQWKLIEQAVEMLRDKEHRAAGLAVLIRARQRMEMLKIPTILRLLREGMEKGYSVVGFFNFTESLRKVAEELKTTCIICGEQTMEERNEAIQSFNNNRSKIILCNIRSGGVGVSLHDVHGGHPRMSIISPTWSAQDLLQALGRIHRAEAKSPAVQRLIYCDEKHEKVVFRAVREKIRNIAMLNDGDMAGYMIEGLTDGKYKAHEELTAEEKKSRQLEILREKRARLWAEFEAVGEEIERLENE